MPTDLHATILQTAIEEGRSLESGLAELHAMRVTSTEAIRAIHLSQQVSLAEARNILAASHVWVPETAPHTAKQRVVFWLSVAVLTTLGFLASRAIRANFNGVERAAAYLLLFAIAYVLGKAIRPWLGRRFGVD